MDVSAQTQTPASDSNPASLELLRRARLGEQWALDCLFARYLPRLFRWTHRRVPMWARNGVDTGDVVQETLLHTIQNLDQFEPQREGALLGYLRRSLANRVRDQLRRAAHRPAVTDLPEELASGAVSPLDAAITAENRRRYKAALVQLRALDRRAIIASVELGYDYDQLALVLDKPTAEAARLAVRRALLRLADQMRDA